MKGKILLVVGLGIGYVLGTRAGREQYDKIKATAQKFWNDPRVQKLAKALTGPEVKAFIAQKYAGAVQPAF